MWQMEKRLCYHQDGKSAASCLYSFGYLVVNAVISTVLASLLSQAQFGWFNFRDIIILYGGQLSPFLISQNTVYGVKNKFLWKGEGSTFFLFGGS